MRVDDLFRRVMVVAGVGLLAVVLVAALVPAVVAQEKCDASTGNTGAGEGENYHPVTTTPNLESSDTWWTIIAPPGTPPTKPDVTEAVALLSRRGTVDPESTQFTYRVMLADLGQITPSISLPLWIWHGAKSVTEAMAQFPYSPRMHGGQWRTAADECLIDAEPGGNVMWICAYGLVASLSSENVAGMREIEIDSKQLGLRASFYEYYYTPFADGTRLVYEYHTGGGVWFREFADGHRIEYEPTTGSYPPPGGGTAVAHERIRRIYRGDYDSPDWQITYDWDANDRLEKITDTRGVEYDYQWSGSPARVTALVVSRPAVQGAPTYRTGFQYDQYGRLIRVLQPKRPFLYDVNHDQSYQQQSEALDECPAVAFAYETVVFGSLSYDRITTVYRESWTWDGQQYGGTATYQETALTMTYGSTVSTWWQVASETEWPSTGDVRVHAYAHVDNGTYGTTTWTDPLGVVRVYEWQEWPNVPAGEGHPALKRNTFRVTRIPRYDEDPLKSDPRPPSDPTYVGPVSWQLTWDKLRILTIEGPYAVATFGQSPPDDPLTVQYSYDGANRGLVTQVQVVPEGNLTTLRLTRAWTYEAWGDPWDGATAKRKASRLRSYTDARGMTWDSVFNENTLQTTVTHPAAAGGQARMTQVIEEDALGRMTTTTEPEFDATVTSSGSSLVTKGSSDGRVVYAYGTTVSSPSYGLLTQVTRYQGLGDSSPVVDTLEYGGVGLLQKVTKADTSATEQEIGIAYDGAMKMRYVYMPDPATGAIPATPSESNWSIELRNDPFGEVACSRRRALKANGTAYTKNFLETWLWYDRQGRPIKSQVDRAPMDQSAADPLVMIAEWDAGGRLSKILGPMYQSAAVSETHYVYDDHGRPYELRRRLTANPDAWAIRWYGFTRLGAPRATKDATGYLVEYTSDDFGRVIETKYFGADSQNPDNRLVSMVLDNEGNVFQSDYITYSTLQARTKYWIDGLGRLTSVVRSDEQLVTQSWWAYGYTGLDHVATVREKLLEGTLGERGRNYAYDSMGRTVAMEDTLSANDGNRVQVVRNAVGDIIERWSRRMREASWGSIDHTWKRMDYVWNRRSELTEVDRWENLSRVVAKNLFTYDQLGRQVERLDRQLNEAGTAWLDWTGGSRSYDALGRPLLERISPKSGAAEDPVDLAIAYTDIPLHQGALHGTWRFVLTRTDGRGNATSYHYDRAGRPVERREPGYAAPAAAFRWLYEYDAEARLSAWVDGNGARVEIGLDPVTRLPVNRKVVSGYSHLSFLTTWEDWTYDVFHRVTGARTRFSSFNQSGAPTLVNATAAWDSLGRIQSEGYEWLGITPAPATVVSSWSTAQGPLDPIHRQQITTGSGWKLAYTHDNGGRLSSMQIEAPGAAAFSELARWRYEGADVLGRRAFTTTGTQNYLEGTFTYDGLGQLTTLRTTWTSGGATLLEDTLKRDWLGNVIWRQYLRCSGGDGDWYAPDGFDRLLGAKVGVPAADFVNDTYATASYETKIDYVLDPAHNREEVTVTPSGGNPVVTTYDVDEDSNRYTMVGGHNFVYDGNGNLVFDGQYLFKYDYLDRLCEVYLYEPSEEMKRAATKPTLTLREVRALLAKAAEVYAYLDPSKGPLPPVKPVYRNAVPTAATDSIVLLAYYGYDPYGRRVGELLPGEDIQWTAWDGWRRTDVYKHGETLQKYKVFFDGDGIDEHLGYAVTETDGQSWDRYSFLQGWLAHIEGVVDASGTVVERYEYDPYGARTIYDGSGANQRSVTAVDNDYGYSGRKHDWVAGLMCYRYRQYHPGIGRFLTHDPKGIWSDLSELGNGYAFCGSYPTTVSDPTGLRVEIEYNIGARVSPVPKQIQADRLEAMVKAMKNDEEGGEIVFKVHPNQTDLPDGYINTIRKHVVRRLTTDFLIDLEGGGPWSVTPVQGGSFSVQKRPTPSADEKAKKEAEKENEKRGGDLGGTVATRKWKLVFAAVVHHTGSGAAWCTRQQEMNDSIAARAANYYAGRYLFRLFVCNGVPNGAFEDLIDSLEDIPLMQDMIAEGGVTVEAGTEEVDLDHHHNGTDIPFTRPTGKGDIVTREGPGLGTRVTR
ncbi:MAG: hypothetical protein JW751_11230 [Polyangiaceae bacterium]|nr:hypothetical protein [Polyangiaceae bacterium]